LELKIIYLVARCPTLIFMRSQYARINYLAEYHRNTAAIGQVKVQSIETIKFECLSFWLQMCTTIKSINCYAWTWTHITWTQSNKQTTKQSSQTDTQDKLKKLNQELWASCTNAHQVNQRSNHNKQADT